MDGEIIILGEEICNVDRKVQIESVHGNYNEGSVQYNTEMCIEPLLLH